MHVLFLTRNNLGTLSGGDKIQIQETQRALESLGVRVTLGSGSTPDLTGIDVVHVFNPSLLSPKRIQYIRLKKIPIVVSSIHWNMREYFSAMVSENTSYFIERPARYLQYFLENEVRGLVYKYAWNTLIEKRLKKIFELADILLPNSHAEAELLVRDFNINAKKIHPVVNGISPVSLNYSNEFKSAHRLNDFVLCVGRIEYRKNQANLIRAMMELPQDLVFIGRPFNSGYSALCKRIADRRPGKTIFLDHADQAEVYLAYQSAHVHALVSWYETPGLASLEAGSCGTNLVVSDRGCTKEYFGADAFYCQPNDLQSITHAIQVAWAKDKNNHLRDRIHKEFTWAHTAQQTLAAYQAVVN